jgi:hypothetical protein
MLFVYESERSSYYCHAIQTICIIAQKIAIANQSTKIHARRSAVGSIYFTIFARAKSTSRLYWREILDATFEMVDVRSALSIIWMISRVKNVCSGSFVHIEREILLPAEISSAISEKSFLMTRFHELSPVNLSDFTILTPALESR